MNPESIIEKYIEGDLYILDAVLELRKIKEFYKNELSLIELFEKQYLSEIEMASKDYPGGDYRGYKFKVTQGRKTFDYSNIPELMKIKNDLSLVQNKYKQAWEGFQKGIQPISEDGEILPLPTVKYSSGYLTIKK